MDERIGASSGVVKHSWQRVSAVLLAAFAGLLLAWPLAAEVPDPMLQVPTSATAVPANTQAPAPAQRPPGQSSDGIVSTAPSIPADQIINKFAAQESEFRSERDNFTYTQTFVIQTIDDDGHPDGEYRMTTDITYSPGGERQENITYAPPPTLQHIMLTEQDLDDLRNIQPFVLTSEDLPKYDVRYVGRQQVDELGTYVFDVAPKKIEKNQRYFQGRIWVEDRDFAIVKTDGKAVPDIITKNNANVFPRFETFRENIEGQYWFPTYTHADDILHFKGLGSDVHIRMIVRYEDYKRFRVSVKILKTTPAKP